MKTRDGYHHGQLGPALTEAATRLAREGGPDAVILREAARRVGVSATAAYRHFVGHDALLDAVRRRAEAALCQWMRDELARAPVSAGPSRLRAYSRGYLGFALAEPGLFRTAFCRGNGRGAAPADPADSPPRRLFREAVEELASYEPTAQCPYPELVCWSAVHGLAVLLVDGRLGPLPPAQCTTLVEAVVDAVRPGPGRPGT